MATATATLEHISEIDGALLARMVREGTARLRTHAQAPMIFSIIFILRLIIYIIKLYIIFTAFAGDIR